MKRALEQGEEAVASSKRTCLAAAAAPAPSTTTPGPGPRSESWEMVNCFYERNKAFFLTPTPDLFGPPAAGAPAQLKYVSSSEFDERIPELCDKIRSTIEIGSFDVVLLWLPEPGGSNFWMSLRCWPLLRDLIDQVRPLWGGEEMEAYDGRGMFVCHLWIDDVLFTGEQMSRLIIENLRIQPDYPFAPPVPHTWLIAAWGMSDVARKRIAKILDDLDPYECSASSADEEEDEAAWPHCIEFVSLLDHKQFKGDDRFYLYTGYKVADSVSIPLKELVEAGHIPGATPEALSQRGRPVKLEDPLPPYKTTTLLGEGDLIAELPGLAEWSGVSFF